MRHFLLCRIFFRNKLLHNTTLIIYYFYTMKIYSLLTLFIAVLVASCTQSSQEQKIRIHSHRGETDFAPQNTAESIKLAFDMGAEMIETDFTLTKEGVMVCIHGRNELKRYWDIDKNPQDLTADDIKNAKNNLKGRKNSEPAYDKKYANVKLPTIDDIFAVIPKDKRFELEIKGYGKDFADKVEQARIKAGLDYWNILVTSFNPEAIKDLKQKYPKYETLFIVYKTDNLTLEKIIATAKDVKAEQIAIGNYRTIDKNFISAIKKAGFKVGVWQVQNLDDLAYATELGVDRVCSDHAYKLRQNYKLLKNLDFK